MTTKEMQKKIEELQKRIGELEDEVTILKRQPNVVVVPTPTYIPVPYHAPSIVPQPYVPPYRPYWSDNTAGPLSVSNLTN